MASLTIDPGLRECSWAITQGEQVLAAGLIRSRSKASARAAAVEMLRAFEAGASEFLIHRGVIDRIVVEGQQHYGVRNRSRPQDLLDLALVAGMVAGALGGMFPDLEVTVPLPREWKGQVDKTAHHRRTCKALGWPFEVHKDMVIPEWPGSMAALQALPAGLHNHVLDAVAMGLWAEGRKGRFFFEGCAAQTLSLTVS